LFLAVQIETKEPADTSQMIARAVDMDTHVRLSYVLRHLTSVGGGRYEIVLSPMTADDALRRTSAMLRAGYRIAYATVTGLRERRLVLKVARPKTQVLVPAGSAVEKQAP